MAPPLNIAPMAGVEITSRVSLAGQTLFYVLNHNGTANAMTLPQPQAFTDLITQETLESQYDFPP